MRRVENTEIVGKGSEIYFILRNKMRIPFAVCFFWFEVHIVWFSKLNWPKRTYLNFSGSFTHRSKLGHPNINIAYSYTSWLLWLAPSFLYSHSQKHTVILSGVDLVHSEMAIRAPNTGLHLPSTSFNTPNTHTSRFFIVRAQPPSNSAFFGTSGSTFTFFMLLTSLFILQFMYRDVYMVGLFLIFWKLFVLFGISDFVPLCRI